MEEQSKIKVTELGQKSAVEVEEPLDRKLKLKKAAIFFLMGIVCLGCLYMIFSPTAKDKEAEKPKINEIVPQASVDEMQDDKGKAYERELLSKKQQDERNSLTALSEYWNVEKQNEIEAKNGLQQTNGQQEAMSSYKNAQHALGNFYANENNETNQLRDEVRNLRTQLAQRETKNADPVASQIALMEKSYQLAAKYLPANGKSSNAENKLTQDTVSKGKRTSGQPVYAAKHQIVSALYREPSDSAFVESLMNQGRFYTVGQKTGNLQAPNSIKACVQVTQTVTHEGSIRLKLLQDARIRKTLIPKGSALVAVAKFQGARLQLLITSIESNGTILPVELTAYDSEGQPGIQLPYSPERNALTEVVANMGNSGGTSIALSSNTNQQLTSDLSRSLIQGVSGYFSKKVRMPQVTLKAGLEVYLVSKK